MVMINANEAHKIAHEKAMESAKEELKGIEIKIKEASAAGLYFIKVLSLSAEAEKILRDNGYVISRLGTQKDYSLDLNRVGDYGHPSWDQTRYKTHWSPQDVSFGITIFWYVGNNPITTSGTGTKIR